MHDHFWDLPRELVGIPHMKMGFSSYLNISEGLDE